MKEIGTAELRAFGVAVRQLRMARNVTQNVLAEVSGLHRTYIGSIERGERNISLVNIYVIARALGTTAVMLIQTAEQILDTGIGE